MVALDFPFFLNSGTWNILIKFCWDTVKYSKNIYAPQSHDERCRSLQANGQ